MKKLLQLLFWTILLIPASSSFAQPSIEYSKAMAILDKKGEVYFRFETGNTNDETFRNLLRNLTQKISIDNVKDFKVYAYANRNEFEQFLQYNYAYEVLPHPGDKDDVHLMAKSGAALAISWNAYPTYPAYIAAMDSFQSKYPDKCEIIQFGTTVKGRKLLVAKITSNSSTPFPKPRFFYASSMHGDETTMYVNLIRLIDYLLVNYDANALIKKLVDSTEIWVCPLENPDGTYNGGDNSVNGAARNNANGVDLNRHYPNFIAGKHPDNATKYEPECQAMMKLYDSVQFVMGANFHGGVDVLNYPWDSKAELHPDDQWMKYVYGKYRDTVHATNKNYLKYRDNGLTNGFAWYIALGTRQDYATYYRYCREVTIEVSIEKMVSGSELPNYWNWNYKAMLHLVEEILYGIRGTIIDTATKEPLKAKVVIKNHDKDSSFTVSQPRFGDYYRPIAAGTYTVEFSCNGCKTKTIPNVKVENGKATNLNIEMDCGNAMNVKSNYQHSKPVYATILKGKEMKLLFSTPVSGISLFDTNGKLLRSDNSGFTNEFLLTGHSNGFYVVKYKTNTGTSCSESFVITK
jgi:hypothetical protein